MPDLKHMADLFARFPGASAWLSRGFVLRALLVAGFFALQIADVVTTKRVLASGGWEGNPLALWAMASFGSYWPVPKLALMALCAMWMFRWTPRKLAPLVALMGVVVANNALWAFS